MAEITPERQRLVLILEATLHFLVGMEMTRDEAIDLKQRVARCVGILNARHNLATKAAKDERAKSYSR